MKNIFKGKARVAAFATAVLATASSAAANATSAGFGQIADSMTTNLKEFKRLIGIVSLLAGVALVVLGLLKVNEANKRSESPAAGFVMIFVGGALASLVAFVGLASGTLFGSNQATGGVTGEFTQ